MTSKPNCLVSLIRGQGPGFSESHTQLLFFHCLFFKPINTNIYSTIAVICVKDFLKLKNSVAFLIKKNASLHAVSACIPLYFIKI